MTEETKKAVDVVDTEGRYIRTYCLESHGDKYKDMAKGFAKKKLGRVTEHNKDGYKAAVIIDNRTNKERYTFTENNDGIHFREQALLIYAGGKGRIENEDKPDRLVTVRVEYRK